MHDIGTPAADEPHARRRARRARAACAATMPAGATGVITIDLAQVRANWRALARHVAPAECGGRRQGRRLRPRRRARDPGAARCRLPHVLRRDAGGGARRARARARRRHLRPRRAAAAHREATWRASRAIPVLSSLERRAPGPRSAPSGAARRRRRCTSTPASTGSACALARSRALAGDAGSAAPARSRPRHEPPRLRRRSRPSR